MILKMVKRFKFVSGRVFIKYGFVGRDINEI